ncbi:N,N-dimethylformamidase beta subunit family domain-containing protein [Streptacidiphilus rugosus]|uniref:N,N-dimethylformamidase beta subunit family domain-containing protein n=1 Tax=Streptacidiphilus rugosus TaxID=405783 RepID=UPI00068CE29B|nr:N,N-dimethylformamidase beta subunit family domain-containing protein [Streptacidiphilus rugosus]
MRDFSRRMVLEGLVGAAGAAVLAGCSSGVTPRTVVSARPVTGNPVSRENQLPGTTAWMVNHEGLKPTNDAVGQIQGFASATSARVGERLAFFVSTALPQAYTISIHRMGYYAGAGGRLMTSSPKLQGFPQRALRVDPGNGMIECPWQQSWSLEIPKTWLSGLYLACFTSADGHRAVTPFVVRDDRQAEFKVVLPFTTYQAYNLFPNCGVGRSLYYGFLSSAQSPLVQKVSPDGHAYPVRTVPGQKYVMHYPERARTVSFRRPYSDHGFPKVFGIDLSFVMWAESQGYDLSYATSLDLDAGSVDPSRHRALLFPGHDEYWSSSMRRVAEAAVRSGTHLAYFASNNVYWKIRTGTGDSGFSQMTCYKDDHDPVQDPTGATTMWRRVRPDRSEAEQGLLGTQYNGILDRAVPLVVTEPGHWFWSGTGLAAGDRVTNLVVGEADGLTPGMPRPAGAREQTLLSASKFLYGKEPAVQNTSVYQSAGGSWIFTAGTFGWTAALTAAPVPNPFCTPVDARIQHATQNLMSRLRS